MSRIALILICVFSIGQTVVARNIYMETSERGQNSPETQGAFLKGRVQVQGKTSNQVDIVPSDTIQPPNLTNSAMSQDLSVFSVAVDVGLLERLDLMLYSSFLFSLTYEPPLVGLKYQVLGASHKDRAPDSFALAVDFMAGSQTGYTHQSGSIQNITTYSEYNSQEKFDVSIGYRKTRDLMYYSDISFSRIRSEGTIYQNPPDVPVFQTYFYSGNGQHYCVAAGAEYHFTENFMAMGDLAYNYFTWSYAGSESTLGLGFSLGYAW